MANHVRVELRNAEDESRIGDAHFSRVPSIGEHLEWARRRYIVHAVLHHDTTGVGYLAATLFVTAL